MLTKPTGLIKEGVKPVDEVLWNDLTNHAFRRVEVAPEGVVRGEQIMVGNRIVDRIFLNDIVRPRPAQPQEQRNQINPAVDNLDF
jgi:hypothetical protein